MTGEGFVIEPDEELDKIEKKYLTEFKNSRDWKQKLKNN